MLRYFVETLYAYSALNVLFAGSIISSGRWFPLLSAVAARTAFPAPAAGQGIGRIKEAPFQLAYQRERQKVLLILPWELDCTDVAVVTSRIPCKWSVLSVLMKHKHWKLSLRYACFRTKELTSWHFNTSRPVVWAPQARLEWIRWRKESGSHIYTQLPCKRQSESRTKQVLRSNTCIMEPTYDVGISNATAII
jgi:hypothetical protein